ncbi:Putative HIRA-interacting protein [Septoria linicola]|uniref:HIRA-interacting protein n=1 Tax=Septoria linicola TaxID=215465 RepID=A0A9Q9AWK7_9PEZI|nr:putative HIRA-interacting protein [Septoria linicola]USW56304.1 Putative HIRA-interacting protein [Septoria linicola]
MSDSDSDELSNAAALPADDQIEQCLKRVTRKIISTGHVTTNKARDAAEQELGLDAGFFKQHDTWKARSKEIVELVVNEDEPSPEKARPKPKPAKPAAKAGRKRKSDEAPVQKPQPRKKARKNDSEDDLDAEESEAEATPDDDGDFSEATPVEKAPAKRKAAKKKAPSASDEEEEFKQQKKAPAKRKAEATKAAEKVVEDSEASDNDTTGPASPIHDARSKSNAKELAKDESELSEAPKDEKSNGNGKVPTPEDDESDMSVLIDEPPKKKRGRKASTEPKAKAKGSTVKATTTKRKAAGEELRPDEEEVKRLQGWLVKCGIRKLWHRELVDCSTTKAKIKHLKDMLEEAGMTGRYSNEKAKDIKESRELAAELEATQEYAKKWGQDKDAGSGDESDAGAQVSEEELKPATRKPKGLVDFGDSGDDGSD